MNMKYIHFVTMVAGMNLHFANHQDQGCLVTAINRKTFSYIIFILFKNILSDVK